MLHKDFIDEPLAQDHMSPPERVVFANAQLLGSISSRLAKHIANENIHVTKEEKDAWNAKVDQSTIDDLKEEIANKADKADVPTSEDITTQYDFVTEDRLKNELIGYVTEDTLPCRMQDIIESGEAIRTATATTYGTVKLGGTGSESGGTLTTALTTDSNGNAVSRFSMDTIWNYIMPLIVDRLEVVDGAIQVKANVPKPTDPDDTIWED